MHGDPAETLDCREAFFVRVAGADVDRQRGAEAREKPERRPSETRSLRGRFDRLVPAAQPETLRRGEPAEVLGSGDLIGRAGVAEVQHQRPDPILEDDAGRLERGDPGAGLPQAADRLLDQLQIGLGDEPMPKFCTSAPFTPT